MEKNFFGEQKDVIYHEFCAREHVLAVEFYDLWNEMYANYRGQMIVQHSCQEKFSINFSPFIPVKNIIFFFFLLSVDLLT